MWNSVLLSVQWQNFSIPMGNDRKESFCFEVARGLYLVKVL